MNRSNVLALGVLFIGLAAPAQPSGLTNVQHVVIFMQENRSFDHYFGALKGVRGFSDPNALIFQSGSNDLYQPQSGGYVLPFHVSDQCLIDLDHGWGPTHAAWNGGKWDQWVPNKGTTSLAFYTRAELAYYYALAEAYTVCDAFFCSVLGPTNPNRLYLWTGMIDPNGTGGGPVTDNSEPGFTWTTYPERLEAAGVSWRVYQQPDNFDDNALAWFTQYQNALPGNPLYDRGMATVGDIVTAFATDVTNGTLPKVSWIIAPTAQSEHPIFSPASGEMLTKRLLDSLSSNPAIYNSTVFILTYDENDGFFDHVPSPVPPQGTPDEFVGGLPIGLGVRVPTIVVSPWSRGGFVCSQVFDFTSIIRFLETLTGVRNPNVSSWRRTVCGDLTSVFNFASPDYSHPLLPVPNAVDCSGGLTPSVPSPQAMPVQESGILLPRPLPYQLDTDSYADCVNGRFYVTMTNVGTAAAHVAIYANGYRTDGPWQYDVGPSGSVTDYFSALAYGGGRYDLTAYGPGGFQRRFAGTVTNSCNLIEVTVSTDPTAGGIWMSMRNSTGSPVTFTVTANRYLAGGPWMYTLPGGNTVSNSFVALTNNGGWYDLTATASNDAIFFRRFAGHIEGVFPLGNQPLITTQPIGQTVDAGTPAYFTVAAVNGPLIYQWQFSGTNIPGATDSSYTIASAAPVQAGAYNVVVSNVNGSTLSAPAELIVNTTPKIVAQFVDEVADVGSSFTFAAQTTGGRPLMNYWYRNGNLVSASLSSPLVVNNLALSDGGAYSLVASNSFGMSTSGVAVLKVYAGPVTSNLVVHLSFDNTFNDTSGHGNHAAYATNGPNANPNPVFVPGQIGQAFQYTTLSDGTRFEYATLGYPTDLRFGVSNDFTVSLWLNYTNQTDDLPFISNKDWNASANQGWGLFSQSGGNFRLNVTGPNSNADKFSITPATVLRDGSWHHLLVSFLRAVPPRVAYVYSYVDGLLVNKSPMSVAGTIDTDGLAFSFASPKPTRQTTWAINVGQDGTGVYYDLGNAYDIGAKIDDLGIWRRALTANEAQAIYLAGKAGADLSHAVVATRLSTQVLGGTLQLNWIGSPTVKLQRSTSLMPPVWTDMPGTLGASSFVVPASNSAAFFRLAQ